MGIPVAYFGSRVEETKLQLLTGHVLFSSASHNDEEQDSNDEPEMSEIERLQYQTNTVLRVESTIKKILESIRDIYNLIIRNDIALLILFNIVNGMLDIDLDQYYYTFKTEVAGISKY